MATQKDIPVSQKGSDSSFDYCCFVCEDNDILTEAEFYCDGCAKWYCDQCVSLHGQMFKKHTTLGRSDIGKWPIAKGVAKLLTQCDDHKEKRIEMFCADHSQLCCSTCVMLDHRQCKKLTQIASEEHKTEHEDLQKLTTDVTDLTQRLRKLIEQRESNVKSLQFAFDTILEEIASIRKKFNNALNSIEQRTINEGKALLTLSQESLQADIDSGKTALNRIKAFQEAAGKIGITDSELLTMACMKIKKELSTSDSIVRAMDVKSYITLSFNENKEIEQYLGTIETLGNFVSNTSNPSTIISTAQQSYYNVQLIGESTCGIRGICEMPNGNIILADYANEKVKLLDKGYNVIGHCNLPISPMHICFISDNKVAAALYYWGNAHEIHFLTVNNNSVVVNETFNLTHPCTGIHYHNGQLYVTSRTALYRYTLKGTLLGKLYEDTSSFNAVHRCAVNACGDRIYVVNLTDHKVLTLDMSGQLLASFTDPDLKNPMDVHVTASGQVLVAGYYNIIQLNSEGTEKIANVDSRKDGHLCICMSRLTGSILVGKDTNDIEVFTTK